MNCTLKQYKYYMFRQNRSINNFEITGFSWNAFRLFFVAFNYNVDITSILVLQTTSAFSYPLRSSLFFAVRSFTSATFPLHCTLYYVTLIFLLSYLCGDSVTVFPSLFKGRKRSKLSRYWLRRYTDSICSQTTVFQRIFACSI